MLTQRRQEPAYRHLASRPLRRRQSASADAAHPSTGQQIYTSNDAASPIYTTKQLCGTGPPTGFTTGSPDLLLEQHNHMTNTTHIPPAEPLSRAQLSWSQVPHRGGCAGSVGRALPSSSSPPEAASPWTLWKPAPASPWLPLPGDPPASVWLQVKTGDRREDEEEKTPPLNCSGEKKSGRDRSGVRK